MSDQQYCLRWNNHQPNFISVFSSLLDNECLVDVTLAAEGKYLQAHKLILSACSSYFQDLFSSNPCQHPIVVLKDISFCDLKAVVNFIYYGEVSVAQEHLTSVLKVAETLSIKGLSEMPLSSIPIKSMEKRPATDTIARRKRLKKSSSGSLTGSTPGSSIDEVEIFGPSFMKSEESLDVIKNTSDYSTDGFHNGSQEAEIFTSTGSDDVENHPEVQSSVVRRNEENVGSISVITGIKKRFRILTRQSHIDSKQGPDGDDSDDLEFPPSPKRPLGRQYSDPTPQQNIPSDLSAYSEKSKLLVVPTSHLMKQHSDSALPSQTENKDPLSSEEDIKHPILLPQPRSNHCPMLRPGPALGCNFCWNTIDNHGRILRRKTKYHCPECRTNLCIVPCFQDYHNKKEDHELDSEHSKENQTDTKISLYLKKHKTASSSSV